MAGRNAWGKIGCAVAEGDRLASNGILSAASASYRKVREAGGSVAASKDAARATARSMGMNPDNGKPLGAQSAKPATKTVEVTMPPKATSAKPMKWDHYEGSAIQAPLSGSGPYTISHRKDNHTVSYRPTGEHHHVGSYETAEKAKRAAEAHAADVASGKWKAEKPATFEPAYVKQAKVKAKEATKTDEHSPVPPAAPKTTPTAPRATADARGARSTPEARKDRLARARAADARFASEQQAFDARMRAAGKTPETMTKADLAARRAISDKRVAAGKGIDKTRQALAPAETARLRAAAARRQRLQMLLATSKDPAKRSRLWDKMRAADPAVDRAQRARDAALVNPKATAPKPAAPKATPVQAAPVRKAAQRTGDRNVALLAKLRERRDDVANTRGVYSPEYKTAQGRYERVKGKLTPEQVTASGKGAKPEAAQKSTTAKSAKPAKAVPSPATMQPAAINKELDALDKRSSKNTRDFIAAGRGNERPSDYLKKTDPLSMEARALYDRQSALRNEIERRMGPRAPSRIPLRQGFGPLKQAW